MATAVKKHKARNQGTRTQTRKYSTKIKLPRGVAQQLENIYFQSRKKVKRHPLQTAGGVLLSLGLASGTVLLIRYLRNL